MNSIEKKKTFRMMQKKLTIAKRALEKEALGCHNQQGVAEEALEEMHLCEIGKTHAMKERRYDCRKSLGLNRASS